MVASVAFMMVESLQGYGLQGKEKHGHAVQRNQCDNSTTKDGEPAGFTLNGFGVQVDVGQLVAVHGAILSRVTGYCVTVLF